MAISTKLSFAKLGELFLDPRNPRLGRHNSGPDVPQEEILKVMADWNLNELAVSFIEAGRYWSQEAMIVIREKLYGRPQLVVLEGNRRLAALINLRNALDGHPADRKWEEMVDGVKLPDELFSEIPYFLADDRSDIEGFLGFRHVTGIEEWRPAEKAEYIARLVDKGFDYRTVMRKIGSKTQTVRQNYISYRLLLRMEETVDIPEENFEERFSVMYLSLRTEGVQKYLDIDILADPQKVKREIPKVHKKALANFAFWLFGDDNRLPLFTDSRQVDGFGRILNNNEAREYLERTDDPNFEVALKLSGGDEPELVRLVKRAADNVELTLTRAHHYRKSKNLRAAVERLAEDTKQLLEVFPDIKDKICGEAE